MTVQPNAATQIESGYAESAANTTNGKSPGNVKEHASNEATSKHSSRLPRARRWSTSIKALVLGIVLVLVVTSGGGTWYYFSGHHVARTDLVLYPVKKDKLLLTIVERGALESADNADIVCRVKAGTKNSTVATTIKMVVDDGTRVKKGDLVAELDDSGLVEQVKSEKIVLDKAESDAKQARDNLTIVESQNGTDIETAKVNLQLAQIDLMKYREGEYIQTKKDLEGQQKNAESDVEQARDRAAWSKRMLQKGYQTQSQAQADQSKFESYELALKKAIEAIRVLDHQSYGMAKRTITDLTNKVEEAKRALLRAETQARAKYNQAETDAKAKQSVFEQERDRYHEYEEEVRKCILRAPQDGLVVYYISEQSRYGSGSQQSIVAQGEPVREGQKLMRITDLSKMLVNTKVHEALVSHLRGEEHDAYGKLLYTGMPAHVRLDSYPDRILTGHVKSVATVASQQDFFSADVKVYQTMVAIDELVDGMKPGMSAEVTILVDASKEASLLIPVESILGKVDSGRHRHCFVMTADGPEEREITVGLTNEKMAEIQSGLREGEQVILNPKGLVGEKIKTHTPTDGEADSAGPSWNGANLPADNGSGKRPGGKAKDGKAGGADSKNGRAGGQQRNPEERQKMQEGIERFRKATPDQRKEMLEQVPETYRDKFKQTLKDRGIAVPE